MSSGDVARFLPPFFWHLCNNDFEEKARERVSYFVISNWTLFFLFYLFFFYISVVFTYLMNWPHIWLSSKLRNSFFFNDLFGNSKNAKNCTKMYHFYKYVNLNFCQGMYLTIVVHTYIYRGFKFNRSHCTD